MKLSFIIEAVDKASRNMKRITGEARDLGRRGMTPLGRVVQSANRQMRNFGGGFAGRLRSLTIASARFAGRAGLMAIERSARAAGRGVMWMVGKAGGLALQGAKWAAAGAGVLGGFFTAGVLKTAGEFEQFQIMLEGVEGSAEKARDAMAWVARFAKDTPYELNEVTEAFVRARGVGIDPLTGAFRTMGDAAAANVKSLMSAVEAIADAQTGEFERLKEFNITTSVNGSAVTFSYLNKAGKNASKTVTKNMTEIRRAVLEIFDERHAGGMLRQSKSLFGIWNNLKDVMRNIQLRVANAGFFDVVKGKFQELLAWTERLEKDGTLARWAKNISGWLSQATEAGAAFIQGLDWKQLGTDVKNAGTLLWGIVKVMAALGKLVGEVAASFGWLGDKMSWLNRHRTSDLVGLTKPKKEIPFSAPKSTGKGWPARMSNSLQPVARRSTAPLLNGAKPAAWPGTNKPVQVGGKLEIELKGSGAAGARVKSVKSANKNVPVSVYRGQSMAGAA